jgi:hypothetical protein
MLGYCTVFHSRLMLWWVRLGIGWEGNRRDRSRHRCRPRKRFRGVRCSCLAWGHRSNAAGARASLQHTYREVSRGRRLTILTRKEKYIPCQQACVDKVEAFSFVQPFCLVVFHDEFYVWANPVRLDSTDVVANDMGLWIFPSKASVLLLDGFLFRIECLLCAIHGPNSSSCTEIQNLLRILDGRFERFSFQQHEPTRWIC